MLISSVNHAAAQPAQAKTRTVPREDAAEKPAEAPEKAAEPVDGPDGAASAEPPSAIKSFTYGALGIDSPEQQTGSPDAGFTAGQWTGAALKVGGTIALLA